MKDFTPLHPDTEINGQMMIDFEEAVNSASFLPIMKKHGLDEIKADEWYPIQKWLDVLKEIDTSASFLDLVSIGMRQIENIDWPPELLSLSLIDFLQGINEDYQQYYRGTDVGEIKVERLSDTAIIVTLRVPEPDDLWYGNLYAIARKWLPGATPFILEYDSTITRRDLGGEKTVIKLTTDIPLF